MGMAGKDRGAGRTRPGGDAGRDGSDAAASHGTPGRQKLGEAESRSPSAFRGSMVLTNLNFRNRQDMNLPSSIPHC